LSQDPRQQTHDDEDFINNNRRESFIHSNNNSNDDYDVTPLIPDCISKNDTSHHTIQTTHSNDHDEYTVLFLLNRTGLEIAPVIGQRFPNVIGVAEQSDAERNGVKVTINLIIIPSYNHYTYILL